MELSQFFAQRRMGSNQLFPASAGGNGKTVLISSYIYWTELMAHALLELGYNVLVASPWYFFWTHDEQWKNFDAAYAQWIAAIKQHKIVCAIGGNTTLMVPHPKTGEPLHRAAGIPAVNFWWDEPRVAPPMFRRGIPLTQYLALLKDDRTLNVIWDADVLEELDKFYGIRNTIHVPIATTPALWAEPFVPMENRPGDACFLGNCHVMTDADFAAFEPDLATWAKPVAARKMADLDRTVSACIESPAEVTPDATDEAALAREFRRWHILDAYLMQAHRATTVQALANRLGEKFTLIGGNWDKAGLRAKAPHSGVPGAKTFYASHKASVNLYGGCVHSGMPLRPYEIASANGLIFTHYNRELPDLFEPGKECVAFRNEGEMLEQLDRILAKPADFNAVVQAGYRRMISHNTWRHRMAKVMGVVERRFG